MNIQQQEVNQRHMMCPGNGIHLFKMKVYHLRKLLPSLWYCSICHSASWCFHVTWNSKSPTYESSSCKLSKMHMCVPSVSGVTDPAAHPPSPMAHHPSPPPSPIPPPSSSQSFLPVRGCQPLCASCCAGLLYSSRYFPVKLNIFYLSFVCFFRDYLCEKNYKL